MRYRRNWLICFVKFVLFLHIWYFASFYVIFAPTVCVCEIVIVDILLLLETHIHRFGFMSDYNEWIYHGENVNAASNFDRKHPVFADDVRNVRLGLAADGFNPFNNMSISYNMWPIVLTTYNLPPWLCMKPEYFDDIETRFNWPDRNDDGIHRTRRLFVFESQCKPMGKQSQVYVEKNVQDRAEFYILNNSPEIETYLNQHKQELQLRACLNPDEAHRNEFADWFFEKIYAMNRVHAPEVTHELLSLASKSNIVVSSYPACIVNGVQFVTHARDVRLKTQNSSVSVPGTENEIFYGQLQEILEFSYLNDFSVVLFKCKWFRCDSRRMVTENNITSINITSESYKDDQFILASQAQQVFYVEDPSRGPNWRVVQHVNHRSIWDITEDGMSDIDLLQDNSSSNFTLFVDLGNLPQINLQRNDGDVIPIVQPFTTVSQHVNETASFLNDDDEEDVSEEDDETVEESADEETDEGNDVVDTEEDDDDHSYRTSDSD
ncbi:hypothetical protein UlMin_009220 [Ulmus minor]